MRFCLVSLFASTIPYFLYRGMSWVLARANEDPSLSILPPSLLLGLILGFLQIMLTIPALFLTLGSYFLSEDLELILASPLKSLRFYFGRLVGVVVGSSWMPFIFIFPILLALWQSSSAGFIFFLYSTIILIPFFVIPSALAILGATLLTYLMPAHRARYVSHALILVAIGAVYLVTQGSDLTWSSAAGSKEIIRVLRFFEVGQNPWLPSTWASKAIELSLNSATPPWVEIKLLYSTMFAALSAAFLVVLTLHPQAYSYARVRSRKSAMAFRVVAKAFAGLMQFFPFQQRALITKDAKVLARDIGQTVQLIVLCILALLYLYNIRIFSVLDSMPKSMATWWRTFLFLGNLCMGAFLTTSICTRLVFPSISLEGRSLWLLQTAPLSYRSLLRAKMIGWLIPIGIVSSVFFASGAAAIGGELDAIIISGILSLIVCYGIVGLAVGLGALFARFDWEHPSQLSASLGSMLFMISAISLVFFNMLPAWFLLAGEDNYAPALGLTLYQSVGLLSICAFLFNLIVVRVALRLGEQKLMRIAG
jgi:ABC-2 type transport system permease protein